MADGIDIGDIETRFNIDLSGLKQMTDQAAKMFEGLGEKGSKGMDVSKGVERLSEQMKKTTATMSDGFSKMQQMAEKGTSGMADAATKNSTKMRTAVGKDVDQMVRDINAKMEQARAAQLKLQSLNIKSATAKSNGDTSKALQFDSQIASAQASMQRYQTQAQALAQSMSREFDAVPASLKRIATTMDANEGQINQLQAKLKGLQASYASQRVPVSGDFEGGFKMGDSKESLQTKAQIDKLQASVTKLIAENDKLNSTYANTEDRAAQLKAALASVNTELDEEAVSSRMAGAGLDSMNNKSSKGGGFFSKLRSGASSFFGLFNRSTNQSNSGMERMNRNMNSMSRQLGQVGASVFLYQILGQGIMSLVTWLWQAVETNSAFAASFNQVRVNLQTAFYPIYTAVMPALTTLMQGLAQVTGVLASFIATLFGTTYSAAKAGASGLQKQVAALNETASDSGVKKTANSAKKLADNTSEATKKAKELQQSLASFDEINTLTKQSDSDNAATPDASTSTPDAATAATPAAGADFGAATGNYTTPAWLKKLAADVAAIAKDLWDPIAAAWNTTGQKVIDAWNYGLKEVLGLVEAIGKSFLEVWDNGTGQKFVENLLQLLADVLNIIGDIAKAFKDAWNDDGRGTRLIQTIFDSFNSILELLHQIAVAFRDAWNSGVGEKIAANILDIFTNIFKTIGNIADRLKDAWTDNGTGEKLFGTLLGMVNDLLGAINDATKATANWAKSIDFSPLLNSVNNLLTALRPFAKNIWDGLDWGYKNLLLPLAKFTIEKVLPDFFDVLAAALKVLNAVIEATKPLASWFWDKFLQPLAKWTGGSFHGAMQAVVSILTGLSDWISKHQKLVDAIVVSLAALLALKVASGWLSSATGILGNLVDKAVLLAGKEHVLSDFFKGITGIDKLEDAVTQLKNMWKVVNENWSGSKMGQWFQNGPLAGSLTSTKSAGGFGNLSTAGKVTTGLAGAGVALGAGWDIVSAIKEKNPTKKFEDFGSGAGTAIGGGLGLYFGGPLGAAIGAQIGGTIGKWAGDAAKSFTDGWNAVGKGKKPDDWLGAMGWDARQMTNKVVAWWDGVQKSNDAANKAQLKAQQKANAEFQKSWNKFWGDVGDRIKSTWDGIQAKTSEWGKDFSKWWSKTSSTIGKNWNSFWSDTGTKLADTWNSAQKKTSQWGSDMQSWWSKTSSSLGGKWNSFWSDTGSKLKTTWQNAKSDTSTLLGQLSSNVATLAGRTRDSAVSAWSGLKSKTGTYFGNIKTTAKSAFDSIANWAGNLGSRMGQGLSSGWSAVKNGASKLIGGATKVIKDAINGVTKGINWVLGSVGSHTKLPYPAFATGGRHKGGPALVNDAPGSVYQEAYRLPDGRSGLFPAKRNLLLNMPAGTQIMPATRVAQKMAAMVPHYAGGMFDFDFDFSGLDALAHLDLSNLFGSVGSTISNVVDSATDTIGKFIGNPSGLWNWVVSKYSGLTGKSGIGADIAGGAIGKMASGATAMLKHALSLFEPPTPGGTGVARWRDSVVSALRKLGLSTSSSMVNRVLRQINTESGGNPSAMGGTDGLADGHAEGLMQVKPGTFAAYHLPGYGNIWKGYDNILAGLNYAQNRYGSGLSFLGQGHGYANGGLIQNDGMYRVGENNLSEMILPLTKPARAVELMKDAMSIMGLSAADLVAPGIVNEPSITSGLGSNSVATSGLSGVDAQTIGKIIAETIADILGGNGGQSDTDMDVSLQVDDDTLAQVVIKAINKRIRKLGHNPIIL